MSVNMTEAEYRLTFDEWLSDKKLCTITFNQYGFANPTDEYIEASNIYYQPWLELRRVYRYFRKSEQITTALRKIKQAGFAPILANYENGCIKTKSGDHYFAYYATTGTIAGYGGTQYEGIDNYIDLLNRNR